MSKLDDLIQKLCPNGVEYKTLGEIAVDIYRGAGITRDQVTAEGRLVCDMVKYIRPMAYGLINVYHIQMKQIDKQEIF